MSAARESHPYSRAAHEQALAQHNRAWYDMREVARKRGRESKAYLAARQDVLDAKKTVRLEARRPRGASHAPISRASGGPDA